MTAEATLRHPSLFDRLNDALNPIVVKELRQAVQSRFVVTMLLVLLGVQLSAVGLYLIFSNQSGSDFDAGRNVFGILLAILLGVSLLFVPAYTAVRMMAERSETDVDLLFITTIKPRSIIAGKMLAALTLTALIFSACLPFMTFTYFLRGIDLPTIFILLCLCLLVVLACSQLALLVACVPFGRVFKVFLGLLELGVCVVAFFATLGGAMSMISFGVGSAFTSWEFWGPATAVLGIGLSLLGLVFALCIALISPPSANRALPVRAYVSVVWLLTGLGVFYWSYRQKFQPPVIIWLVISAIVLAVALLVAVSERDEPGRRVLRGLPRRGWLRWLAFPFYSGAANGVVWACALGVLTLALAWGWRNMNPLFRQNGDLRSTSIFAAGLLLLVYCYALSGALLRRISLRRLEQKWTWLVSSILMMLGITVPFLLGFLFFFSNEWWRAENAKWLVGNPFAFGSTGYDTFFGAVGAVWAVVLTTLSLPWCWARWRRFHPPAATVVSDDE